MQATAIAQPNIALIKYWGKRDVEKNLPAVGSISITLSSLYTETCVELAATLAGDRLIVNGEESPDLLPRISSCLDAVLGKNRKRAIVNSHSNFPIAAGLASSASAFAATTVAAAAAGRLDLDRETLANLAGFASGSAARSLYGGFTELHNESDSVRLSCLSEVERWPLQVIVAVTETGPKTVGSTEAMDISRLTSPFYDRWVDQQAHDLDVARSAISAKDFHQLGAIAEHNCLKMHSVMWASRPPMVYWNAATMRCMQTVRSLQADGCGVFFTIDAGPQVKAVCLPEHAEAVAKALANTEGVLEVMTSGLGQGARLVASQ